MPKVNITLIHFSFIRLNFNIGLTKVEVSAAVCATSYRCTVLGMLRGLREFQARRISRQSAHESGKVVSPPQRPPLPPGDIPGTHFR